MATYEDGREVEDDETDLEDAVARASNGKTNGTAPVQTAAAPVRTTAPAASRRKPSGRRRAPIPNAPAARVEQPASRENPSPSTGLGDLSTASTTRDKNAAAIWNSIIEEARLRGELPDYFFITCTRYGMSFYKEENRTSKVQLENIDGAIVSGNDLLSPGQMLVEFVTDVYHPIARAPARYVFTWHYKSGRAQLNGQQGELVLAHPEEIARMRAAANAFAQRNGGASPNYGGMPPRATPQQQRATGMGGYPQAPQYGQQRPWETPGPAQYMPPPPPPPPGASPELVAQLVEANRMVGAYNEMVRREGLAGPPPGPTAEQQAQMTAVVVASTLKQMGFTPELIGRLNTPTPATTATVATTVANPIEAFQELFKQIHALDKFKLTMRDTFFPNMKDVEQEDEGVAEVVAKEEDPSEFKVLGISKAAGFEVKHGSKKEDEGTFEYILRWGSNNPDAMGAIMAKAAATLPPHLVERLFERFMSGGGAAGAAAAEVKQATHRGFVESAVATPPTVPAAPAGGPPRGWSPGA